MPHRPKNTILPKVAKVNIMSCQMVSWLRRRKLKKCERISKKNQRKVKNGSQERKLVVGHKENEFGFSINKLEIFKFPESQENQFSEMLDLVRFTDCYTSFTQMDNKFEQKVDEEAPYLCQIKQGSENEID